MNISLVPGGWLVLLNTIDSNRQESEFGGRGGGGGGRCGGDGGEIPSSMLGTHHVFTDLHFVFLPYK